MTGRTRLVVRLAAAAIAGVLVVLAVDVRPITGVLVFFVIMVVQVGGDRLFPQRDGPQVSKNPDDYGKAARRRSS